VVATRRLADRLVVESFQRSWRTLGVNTADVAAGEVRLEGSDGAELVELLGFVRDWLGGPDSEALAISLARFVGSEGYDLVQLRADLVRFRFLLGGDDGDLLFGADGDS
jgi:hypothetical protein